MDKELIKLFTEKIDDGRYSLEAVIIKTQEGINLYLGGGELSHIGSVAISTPRESLKGDGTISCTTSVYNCISHKDDALAIPLAEEISKKSNSTVVVTAGVHIEKATQEELSRLQTNFLNLKKRILETLQI